jgi:pyridoxal phosphate enzyme (YggS family)
MGSAAAWEMDEAVQGWAERIRPRYQETLALIEEALRRSGRSGQQVGLIGVTKTLPLEAVLGAASAGFTAVGENRVQEAVPKLDACLERGCDSLEWHLIGHLQRNKASRVVGRFPLIHSVDSMRLASAISRLANEENLVQPVLIQIDISGEESKFGWAPDALERDLDDLLQLPGLDIRGWMTIAPFLPDPEDVRPVFEGLRLFSERMSSAAGRSFPELSMGMSGDFEVAVEEGATMVRVGSRIFGARA